MLTNDQLDIRVDAFGGGISVRSEIYIEAGHGTSVAVPDAHLLFSGEYHRVGSDLQISDGDLRLTIHDYFRAERRPSLVAPNGAMLSDDVVAALATSDIGERYAQVGAGAASAQIGRVETMTGSASAVRNGVSVELHPGDPVLKGDAVQTGTGSSLGISFIDGTIFSLSASARMVLNDMVYQAGGTGNSAALTLVQGSIGFLAGQVAKTGTMQVGTPVATMGIRGTLVFTENPPTPTGNTITSVDGVVSFSIGRESDGRVGTYQVTPLSGPSLTVNDPSLITYVTPGGSVSQDSKPDAVLQAEILLTQQIYQIASLAQANQPGVPNGGPQGGGGGGGGSSTPPDINGGSSFTPGGPGNGQPVNPGGFSIPAPDFSPAPAPPPVTAQQPIPIGPAVPAIPATPDTIPPTGTEAPSPPPPLASQTVPLGQDQVVAVTTQRAGLLYSGGADAATVASEHVSFVEPGPRDDASHVAVDAGRDGTSVAGEYGTLTIHQDGTYSYASLRSTPLAEGEVGLDRFTYTVVNASGQSSLATLTFRITGANDTPVAASDSAAASGGNTVAATTRAAGLLGNDTDPDHDETSTLHITAIGAGTAASAVGGTGPTSIHGQYGTLSVSADGTYSYVQDATSPLGPGQVGVERFTYTVADIHGASDNGATSGSFTIQVTGAGPFLDLDTGDGSAQTGFARTYSGAGTLLTSPNVAITDPDRTAISFATITLTQAGNRDTQDTLSIDSATLARDHLLFSGSSGTYTLATMPGATASDADYADALRHVTFTASDSATIRDVVASIQVNDGTRNSNVAASTIHLGATSFSGTDTGDVTESGYLPPASGSGSATFTAGTPTSTGALHDSLADGRMDAFQPVATGTTSSNGYGSYTVTDSGTWTYTLDNTNSTVQALQPNQTASDTITLTAADGVTHAVTITIHGTDDAPVTQPNTNAFSVASGTTTVTGNVLSNDSDPEGDTLTVTGLHNDAATQTSFTAAGTYGTLTLNQDGSYSYVAGTTADQAAADQALGEGSPGTDTFTYTASDPTGASSDNTLTITVYGVDDAPTVRTANTVASYILGNGAVQVDPSLQLGDPDNATLKSARATLRLGSDGDVLIIPAGDYGDFSVDSSSMKLVFKDGAVLDQSYSSESFTLTSEGATSTSTHDGTVSDFQEALQQLRFSATSDVLDTRFIDLSASDGSLTSSVASGRATVSNSSPTAADDFFTVAQNASHFGTLPAASDSGSTYAIEQPLHGTVVESGTTYVYTPTTGYIGSDSFVYRVTDADGTHAYSVTVGVEPNAGIEFGFSLANLGDIDANGLSDEGTGAPGNPQGGVAFMSQFGTEGTGAFGYAIANVGDLRHAGLASTAVGAPLDIVNGVQTGDVYVYHHTANNGIALDFKILGTVADGQAGAALSTAGYFHQDSSQTGTTPDIVVGAPGANSAYVVYGNATADVDLGNLAGKGVVIHDATSGDQFGFAVAGGGDYRASSDHHADIVVGAPGTASSEGAAYVIFGSSAPADIADISSGSFNGFKITGAAAGDQFGYAVAHLGDVNGDGYDDFAIGAPGANGGAGAVYVVYGSPNLASVSLSALESGSGGFVVHGSVAGGHLGYSVASAGDADGDGRDDILIGAPNVSSNEKIDNGTAYLVLGSHAGTFTVSDTDVVLTGDRPGNELGSSVATTGDSSGSGLAGYAAGAPHSYDAISNTANSGYYASTGHGADGSLVQGTNGNDNGSGMNPPALTGTADPDNLDGLQGSDRIVGLGGGDHLIGGSGADTFVFSAADPSGHNTIADFHAALATAATAQRDIIEIDSYGNIGSFDDLRSHLSAVNSHDTLIDLGTDHTILLKNVAISSLSADDFTFHPPSA